MKRGTIFVIIMVLSVFLGGCGLRDIVGTHTGRHLEPPVNEADKVQDQNDVFAEDVEPETDIGELISTETVYVDENNYIIVSVFEDKYLLRDYVIYGCFEGTDLSNEYSIFAYLTAEIFDRGLNGTMVWVSGEDSIVYSLENGTRFTYSSEDFAKYENVEMDISPELCLEIENVFDRIEEIK